MKKIVKFIIIILWFCSLNIVVDSISDILGISDSVAVWLYVAIFILPFVVFKIKSGKSIYKVVSKYLLLLLLLAFLFIKPVIFIMLSIVIVVIIGSFIGNDSSTTKVEVNQTDKRKKRDDEFRKQLNEDLMKKQLERRREELKRVERKIYIDSHKYLDKKN